MEQSCLLTNTSFSIPDAELTFCREYNIPLPVIAPRERLRELAVRRNRVHLFPSVCAATHKKILSMVPPDSGFQVYDSSVWYDDGWDASEHGREYDFTRPFFEQWYELERAVPLPNLAVIHSTLENSDYTNGILGAKNCYLLFGSNYNEECLFSVSLNRSRSVFDSIHGVDSELCYECTDFQSCYQIRYSNHCSNCSDSYFLESCIGCKNCFGCVNLAHAEYCFFNEKLSRREYESRITALNLHSAASVAALSHRFAEFRAGFPVRAFFGLRNEGSKGNYLVGTKGCLDSFFVTESEDLMYCMRVLKSKNCIAQLGYGIGTELVYNSATIGEDSYNIRFCSDCWSSCRDLEYCLLCINGTASCFGSVGLKRRSYCILNKQYTKSEYFDLLPRIRAHMESTGEYGRFFPPFMSPYPYNASEGADYFPLAREAAVSLGFRWRAEDPASEAPEHFAPDTAEELAADAAKDVFQCVQTGKPYRFVRQEIEFYQTHRIPPPRVAPLERIRNRLGFYTIPDLLHITCRECGSDVVAISPHANRHLLCETCFQSQLGNLSGTEP